MTYHREAQLKAERRKNLKLQGLCQSCGRNPVGTNQDGSVSVRCNDCRQQQTVHTSGRLTIGKMKDSRKRPPRSDEWGITITGWDETRDYLDYAAQVGVLILTAHGPWIGDPGIRVARINEWFGEKVNREWTGHAIKQLLAVAVISESWVIPYRYARNPRPVKDIRYRAHYNNGKQGIDISPKNATVPYPQMAHERS